MTTATEEAMRTFKLALALAIVLGSVAGAHAQSQIIYPAKGQAADQQQKDEGECSAWAKQNTGVDPVAVAQAGAAAPAPSGPQGERVRGAARGALAGAAVGAIAGDAGKGAAIGAAGGTVAGGSRQRREARAAESQAAQTQQQSQQALATYNRAYAACLEGRGYTVK